ncbi:MAG: sugar ABC transporter permease [Clostridia bacterium]|nr:sugar ABC transporter permease [Clostridia bacterium]
MACFLALPIVNFILFYIVVNIDSFFLAFQRPKFGDGFGAMEFSLENFKTVFKNFSTKTGDGIMLEALKNTMLFFLNGLVLGLPISVLMSYFVYKKIKLYKVFRFVTYLPCIITSSALVILFQYMIGRGGPIDALVYKFGGSYSSPLTSDKTAIWTILFYSLSFGFGGNLIVCNGAMLGLDPEMLEAAELGGCNWVKELIYIILPSIWPTISTIVILSVASFLGSTGPILAFTKGAKGTMTLSYYIYKNVAGSAVGESQDFNMASAVGLLMTLVSFPLTLVVRNIIYKEED